MASMEEIMGLYGGLGAPGAQDELRRRRGPGTQGGIGGPEVTANMLRAYVGGAPQWGYSGPMAHDLGPGSRGLADLAARGGGQSPALRHFQDQGFQPPGQMDERHGPGGPNIAPGNIDNARALFQEQGPDHVPGVPQGVAFGQQEPGQGGPRPQTQGWRNIHGGYAAAAQFGYGTPEFGQNIGLGGGRPAPGAQVSPPGGQPGGGRSGPAGGGGGGQSQNPIGGGGGPGPQGGPAAQGGTQGGGAASGGKGGGGQAPAGVTPAVKQQSAGQSTARGGTGNENMAIQPGGRTVTSNGFGDKISGPDRYGRAKAGDASGSFGDTIHVVPNAGNNNTPSETGGQTTWADTHTGTHVGETASQKAARLAAKSSRQEAAAERARVKAAPSASSFGADPRGTGTEPIKGKTKAKSTNVGQYGGKRR